MTLDEQDLADIAAAWVSLHLARDKQTRDEHFWAVERLDELVNQAPDDAWTLIHRIRELDGSDTVLANLAAGPLEDLLVKHGEVFIDKIETCARRDGRFRKVLAGVWRNTISVDVWACIQKWRA